MKNLAAILVCLGLVTGTSLGAAPQDEARAIIDKAIKAHGGAEKLNKVTAMQVKSKGTADVLGGINFTKETLAQMPGQFKDMMELELMGNKYNVLTVFDGTKAWIRVNDMTIDAPEIVLTASKEAAYFMKLTNLIALNDKSIELSLLGEVKVNDRPAVGVRVSSKGHPDMNMYFDKETGLTARTEHRTRDQISMQEVTEETTITEYQDSDGRKVAKKTIINHDGKKYVEVEITEIKFLDKFDASEFAKP
jgi:hypothetical protein